MTGWLLLHLLILFSQYCFWPCSLFTLHLTDQISHYVFVYQKMYNVHYICFRPIPRKLRVNKNFFMIIFPSFFIIYTTDYQYTIIILQYTLFTSNIFVSFDHIFCKVDQVTLMIFPSNIWKSIYLFFKFRFINSFPSLSLCF